MTELFKTISNYHFFNYLLPGSIATYYFEKIYSYPLGEPNIVVLLCIYYLAGLLISRIGSLIISLIPKRYLGFQAYDKYIKACQKDSTIVGMYTIANMYRTMAILSLLIGVFEIAYHKKLTPICLFAMLGAFLLIYSYKKQVNLIVKRVQIALKQSEETDKCGNTMI